jgi:hypothetical protein
MDLDFWRTFAILKPPFDVGVIDICQNLELLQLLGHAPQSPLFVHVTTRESAWIDLLQPSDTSSFRLNLLELLRSVGDQDLSGFLEALVWQFIERNAG